jgi:hypothetical protein
MSSHWRSAGRLRCRPTHCVLAIATTVYCATTLAQTQPGRTLYRCTVDGVTTFSDRPCAADASVYEPDTSRVSTYDPPPVTRSTAPAESRRAAPARQRASSGQDQVRHAAACERLRDALKGVAARMRAGYNAKQGEQLRERKAKLDQQRRAQKCR